MFNWKSFLWWALCQHLPWKNVGIFKTLGLKAILTTADDADTGYFVELKGVNAPPFS